VQGSSNNYASLTARGLVPNRWDIIAFPLVFGILLLAAKGAHETLAPLSTLREPVVSLDPVNLPEYALRTTLRMLAAMAASLIFTLSYGTLAAKEPLQKPAAVTWYNACGVDCCIGSGG
jgi:NitT/TauT family transport system permease protein